MILLNAIRHAPVALQYEGRFIGVQDVPLSPIGRMAACELGIKLSDEVFGSIFVSPLIRAKETSELLFPRATPCVLEDLRERSLGTWEMQSKHELRQSVPEAFMPSGRLDPLYTPPGGESIVDFNNRIKRGIKTIAKAKAPVWLVTHNAVILALRAWTTDQPIREVFMVSEPHVTPTTIRISDELLNSLSS